MFKKVLIWVWVIISCINKIKVLLVKEKTKQKLAGFTHVPLGEKEFQNPKWKEQEDL